ncbi:head-tail joining protein [Rhizobacter sp. P5_C2]
MLDDIFSRKLAVLYARLGRDAQFTPAGGDAQPVRVVLDESGSMGLDGMQMRSEPTIRMQSVDAPNGVRRGDRFVVAGKTWEAREAGVPVLDGTELQVELKAVLMGATA